MTGDRRGVRDGYSTGSTRVVSLPLVGHEVPVLRLYIAMSLIVLNVCDVLLTKAVLHRGGLEANPLMKDLMAGYAAPIGVKALAAATAGLLLVMCPARSRLADRAAAAVAGLYFAVVLWNSALLGWLLSHGL